MSQQVNLFNPVFLKQKKLFSAVAMLQALCLILVGSLLLGAFARYQLTDLTAQAATTSKRLTQAKADLAQSAAQSALNDKATNDKSQAIASDIRKKETELASLRYVFGVLDKGDFGNTQGYAKYFRVFSRQSVEGVWLTGFTLVGAGNDISIQGRALQPEMVPAYIGRLTREPLMHGKSFAKLDVRLPAGETGLPRAAGTAGPGRALPSFVEFNLQSSGTAASPVQSGAAK
ncbi:MAG: MSHA biogenesis protein MshI [Herminiimonas sp.]|nr:MSHA biogenesis protein MshI [Herminiimonas sp.]